MDLKRNVCSREAQSSQGVRSLRPFDNAKHEVHPGVGYRGGLRVVENASLCLGFQTLVFSTNPPLSQNSPRDSSRCDNGLVYSAHRIQVVCTDFLGAVCCKCLYSRFNSNRAIRLQLAALDEGVLVSDIASESVVLSIPGSR